MTSAERFIRDGRPLVDGKAGDVSVIATDHGTANVIGISEEGFFVQGGCSKQQLRDLRDACSQALGDRS
jgi:hypothetical protein